MPSRLIKDENGMCTGADFGGDLIEVQLHGLAVAGWQNQGGTGTLLRNVARSGARSGPTIGQLVLLADPHLVLEPHLYRCTRSERTADFRHAGGKVFLNASIASVLCF